MILITNFCQAQQDAQYTQYMYNTISVNPAYAGSRGVFNAVLLHRTQWYGIQGAPSTQTLSFNTPFGKQNQLGIGASIINEKIGPSNATYFNIDFSYSIFVSEIGKLSFGLKAGGHLISVDFEKLNLNDLNDGAFTKSINNKLSPNIGFGMYYHTDDFYVGLSVPNLLETNHLSDGTTITKERMHYYFINGYIIYINNHIKFKPAIISKLVFGAPLQIDVSANFLFHEKLTLGLAYRWSAAVSALVGFQVSDTIMLGVSYDRETTALGNASLNNGSYEFMLRFQPKGRSIRRLTPRFF